MTDRRWPIELDATIVAGRLRYNRRMLLAELDGRKDGPIRITIDRLRGARSTEANAYYWAVVLKMLSDHTGYHPDELHEHFKQQFLGRDLILSDGEGVIVTAGRVGLSTTKLSIAGFYAYVERIRQVAAEMGVVTPDPDPRWKEKREHEGAHA